MSIYDPEDDESRERLQEEVDRKNADTSRKEVAEFLANPPEKYFLYINEKDGTATTWTGEKLGTVRFGREYRSPAFGGFPSVRQSVRVEGINGVSYFGTYYKSSGNYARIKRAR